MFLFRLVELTSQLLFRSPEYDSEAYSRTS